MSEQASQPAVSVRSLVKRYGETVAVAGISFDVREGEVFGLLGPNGSGKTTTFECLEGLRRRSEGSISVCDVDPEREPGRLGELIGVQLQAGGLPRTMTPVDAMTFFSAYRRRPPRLDLLERFGLSDSLDTRYEHLSTGLQRRLSLALAVAHDPQVLILDEPTAGLDVASRSELHLAIQELSAAGRTVLLATHDMAEAEQLTDRVAILLRGRIVATGSPRELTAASEGLTKVSIRTESMTVVGVYPPGGAGPARLMSDGYAVTFSQDPGPTVAALLEHASHAGDPLIDLRVERPSLEERFLELTEAAV